MPVCPKCGSELVKRNGKYGEFWGCSNYPECTYTENIIDEEDYEYGKCPDCGSPLRLIEGRYGDFYGCTNYPECTYTENNSRKRKKYVGGYIPYEPGDFIEGEGDHWY